MYLPPPSFPDYKLLDDRDRVLFILVPITESTIEQAFTNELKRYELQESWNINTATEWNRYPKT